MEQVPKTGIKHTKNLCSVGFQANQFAMCEKAVSFQQIEVREGSCKAAAGGSLQAFEGTVHDASKDWFALAPLVKDKGYKWTNEKDTVVDTVYAETGPPYNAQGQYSWTIPMMWRKKGTAGDGDRYSEGLHFFVCAANGDGTISKSTVGPFTKLLGDADSNY